MTPESPTPSPRFPTVPDAIKTSLYLRSFSSWRRPILRNSKEITPRIGRNRVKVESSVRYKRTFYFADMIFSIQNIIHYTNTPTDTSVLVHTMWCLTYFVRIFLNNSAFSLLCWKTPKWHWKRTTTVTILSCSTRRSWGKIVLARFSSDTPPPFSLPAIRAFRVVFRYIWILFYNHITISNSYVYIVSRVCLICLHNVCRYNNRCRFGKRLLGA